MSGLFDNFEYYNGCSLWLKPNLISPCMSLDIYIINSMAESKSLKMWSENLSCHFIVKCI